MKKQAHVCIVSIQFTGSGLVVVNGITNTFLFSYTNHEYVLCLSNRKRFSYQDSIHISACTYHDMLYVQEIVVRFFFLFFFLSDHSLLF